MKIVVLDAATLGEDLSLSPIQEQGDTMIYLSSTEAEVKARIRDAECVIVNKVKLSADVLQEAPALRLICLAATGYDNVDIAYCKEHQIAVCNVVGYSSHSVAQLTAAMVLSLSVHLGEYSGYVASGSYSQSGLANKVSPVFHELCGKTWGLIGCGNIGREVAAVAAALGCRVIVHKQTPSEEFTCVDLDTLCKNADIITIHTPLTDSTRGMIDQTRIALMKKDVILVNAARGAVLDERAVCDAVLDGKIGAFGTDVYTTEPFPKEHPFDKMKDKPNVCLTPHMAWGSYEARNRCVREIAENIKAFEKGETRNRVEI